MNGREIQQCAGCENVTLGHTCHVCENEYQEGSRHGRMQRPDVLCTDCAPPCVSCEKPVCESHRRASVECVACSGPTDAEQAAHNGAGNHYSSEAMAGAGRID